MKIRLIFFLFVERVKNNRFWLIIHNALTMRFTLITERLVSCQIIEFHRWKSIEDFSCSQSDVTFGEQVELDWLEHEAEKRVNNLTSTRPMKKEARPFYVEL